VNFAYFLAAADASLLRPLVKQVLGTKDFMPELKAAYREVGKDEFTILHPTGLNHFAVA